MCTLNGNITRLRPCMRTQSRRSAVLRSAITTRFEQLTGSFTRSRLAKWFRFHVSQFPRWINESKKTRLETFVDGMYETPAPVDVQLSFPSTYAVNGPRTDLDQDGQRCDPDDLVLARGNAWQASFNYRQRPSPKLARVAEDAWAHLRFIEEVLEAVGTVAGTHK